MASVSVSAAVTGVATVVEEKGVRVLNHLMPGTPIMIRPCPITPRVGSLVCGVSVMPLPNRCVS